MVNNTPLVVQAIDLVVAPADLIIVRFYFKMLQGEASGF